ncbi:MAG: diguanylate cyclase [Propionivibrio sp.]
MATLSNPSEIARETLKQLMTRRVAPSPDNYRAIYNEISGVAEKGKSAEPFPERELKALLLALPKESPAQQRLARLLDQAIKKGRWEDYRKPLVEFVKECGAEAAELAWAELISELLRQWETKQSGLTQNRKREALDRVLTGTKSSELLFSRLQNLARSWSRNEAEPEEIEVVDATAAAAENPLEPPAVAARIRPAPPSELLPELRDLFVYTMEVIVATQLDDAPDLAAEARVIAAAVYDAGSREAMQEALASMKRFAFRLEFLAEDRRELRTGLLKLLELMIDNVGELALDDQWLNGQIEMVREIIARPLSVRAINDAEHRLKEVIYKQSQLKHSLVEARETLKHMLAGFVDHLAEFADSTSDYHDKIEASVEKISKAEDISQLEDVLAEVISETRIIQVNAQRSRDELRTSKQQVEEAEKRISALQLELEKASTLVRHDQLTGALNRRGLEEAIDQEVARAQRRKSPLCVALLDIDNFKKLNDALGHDAGDAALIHLVTVIRETLRPQDTLARFGGEEFIVLLPDTQLDDAKKALARLQRQLTKRFFLNDNEKILITFSAGVTEYRADDSQASVTKRADEAMFAAKRAGKNQVMVG